MEEKRAPPPFTERVLEYPPHPAKDNARTTTAIEHKNSTRRMSAILDIKFSSWAEQETRPGRGFNEFSEYIKRDLQEKCLKYSLGENCMSILDSRLGNYT